MRDTTVAVKISEDQKAKWESYIEENPEVESMSHLLRLAVNKELADSQATQQIQVETETEASTELLEGLQRIEDRLNGVEGRLGAIERESEAEGPSYDLQKVVFELLPSSAEAPNDAQPHEWAVTTDDLAKKVGTNTEDIQNTLDRLIDTVSQVQAVHGKPGTFYYKQE